MALQAVRHLVPNFPVAVVPDVRRSGVKKFWGSLAARRLLGERRRFLCLRSQQA